MRQGDTHDSGFAAIRMCPLAKPATQILRWPSEGKCTPIGWAVGVIMNHWGVSSCCINPPVAMAHHRNDANTPRTTPKSNPLPPKPPRPSGVTIVGRTTATATLTTSHNHCAQAGWQHEVRQGDTHDSGFAAIRGVPLPNQQRKFCDGPVRVNSQRLGGQSGSS